MSYRPSELRYAFATSEPIPSSSLCLIETGLRGECGRLVKEIDSLTNRPAFGYALQFDFENLRVYRT
jgi:hypothetical protein